MIANGSYIEETHQFKTAVACLAFCRVHPDFSTTTAGNAGYLAVHKHGLYSILGAQSMLNDISGCSVQGSSLQDQLKETIQKCELSYKNIITASLLGSLTSTEYKLGNYRISHPIIFTYGIATAAPELTLWSLLMCMFVLVGGALPWLTLSLLASVVFIVEVVLPWVNKFNQDPIEEPWLIPKWLDENGIER